MKCTWVMLLAVLLTSIALVLLTGCSAHQLPLSQAGGVPWPPPSGVSHQATSDNAIIPGAEAVDFGGGARIDATSMRLVCTPGLVNYGIWSMSGFSSVVDLARIQLEFSWLPDPPLAQTKLFIGLANFAKGTWEWDEVSAAEQAAGQWTHLIASDENYINNGTCYVAAVATGIGSASINAVGFVRFYDTTVPLPLNLHVTETDVGSISLDWDDVTDATGYNVFRSNYADFRDAQLVAGSPFIDSQCTDLTGFKGWIMYYKVSALRGAAESPLSNLVDIFCPEADLVLPENIQIGAPTETTVEISWDWSGGFNPETWVVYWKKYQDFNLFYEGETFSTSLLGWVQHYTIKDLEPGAVYYFRIAARDADSAIGRMTDDAPLATVPPWEWGPAENTGIPAQEPLRAIVVDGDITATYFNLQDVRLARRDQGAWTEHATTLCNDYTTSQAVGYAGGEYVIAARSLLADDVYATVGTPEGGWTAPARIHGDGDTSEGHPWSGVNLRLQTNTSEFSLIHWASDTHQVILQTKPVGINFWTTLALRDVDDPEPGLSLCYAGTNLGVIIKDYLLNPVYFGERDNSFTFTAMSPDDGAIWGRAHALGCLAGQWIAIVQSFADTDPYFYSYNGSSWDYTPLEITPTHTDGHFELEVDGAAAYLLLWTSPSSWHFLVLEDGGWAEKTFTYPAKLGSDPQLVVLNHDVYIVYVDPLEDILVAIKGTPPA